MPEPGKLILVDDSPLFRARMTDFLKMNYSFEIEEFNSIKELQNYIKDRSVKEILLIIMDLYLPDGNGLSAIRELKHNKGFPGIPFLLVSARIDKETVALAYTEGAKDVIAKPVNYEKLKLRIDKIISPEYKIKDKKSIMDYHHQITNEIKRAQRGSYNLSIFLAGIFQKVDFKSVYKDNSYRKVIDLEKKYPEELQKIMRDTDTIVSLSPSEYLFILPFTDKNGTAVIRKKIKQVFNSLITEKEKDSLLMVMGAATYPEDGESTDELILKIEENFKKQFASQGEDTEQTTPTVNKEKPATDS